MLKIRLQRVGKKHDPSYRVVLTDSRQAAKAGTCIELLGNYNPKRGEPVLKGDKIKEWIAKGAQTSDTVNNLLVKHGIIEGAKRDVLHHTKIAAKRAKKAPAPAKEEPKKEEVVKEEAPAEEKSETKEEVAEVIEAEKEVSPTEVAPAEEAPTEEEMSVPAEEEVKE